MLTILIESACSNGNISDDDRQLLLKKAKAEGISEAELNKMIEQALEKDNDNDDDELASGFITEDDENITTEPENNLTSKKESVLPKSNFTNITAFHEQGAMSLVQKGKLHGKWIIIKRIKPEFKDNAKYKELFWKEFENAYHLDHPNIVRLLDKGEDAEGLFYTMEFIDGRPLSDLSQPNGIKNPRHIKKIFSEMLDALAYVHKKQIYHRDLKPDNIYITFRGDNVKILDFGLAAADDFDDNLIKAGTPKYAAPEQMTKAKNVDQRADIYTLGLILLEMLTGDVKDITAKTIENPNYKYIIEKCLKTNPEDRFYDCQEIIDSLNREIKPEINKDEIIKNELATLKQQADTAFYNKEYQHAKNLYLDYLKKDPSNQEVKKRIAECDKYLKNTGKKKKPFFIPIIIGAVLIAILTVLGIIFKDKIFNSSGEQTNSIIEDANNFYDKGKLDSATVKYEQAITEDETLKEKYSERLEVLKTVMEMKTEADNLLEKQNIARALVNYLEIIEELEQLGSSVTFNKVNDAKKECEDIINNITFENLTVKSENNKYGLIDENGNVVVDYLFDEIFYDDYYIEKLKVFPLRKGKGWGFLYKDNNGIHFIECKYAKKGSGHPNERYWKEGKKICLISDVKKISEYMKK